MVYLVGYEISDFIYLLFFACIIGLAVFVVKRKKKFNSVKKYTFQIIAYFIPLFLGVFLSVVCVIGLSEKLYAVYAYNSGKYCITEGEISNLEYIYENNGNSVRGVRFCINETKFELNKGYLNAGYSVQKGIITQNGDSFKVYYIPTDKEEPVSLILRIDASLKE